MNISKNDLNNDLQKIHEWEYQWKTIFNLDLSKQGQEMIFSEKFSKHFHQGIQIYNNQVNSTLV